MVGKLTAVLLLILMVLTFLLPIVNTPVSAGRAVSVGRTFESSSQDNNIGQNNQDSNCGSESTMDTENIGGQREHALVQFNIYILPKGECC